MLLGLFPIQFKRYSGSAKQPTPVGRQSSQFSWAAETGSAEIRQGRFDIIIIIKKNKIGHTFHMSKTNCEIKTDNK